MVRVQSLPWELPHAMGAAKKKSMKNDIISIHVVTTSLRNKTTPVLLVELPDDSPSSRGNHHPGLYAYPSLAFIYTVVF